MEICFGFLIRHLKGLLCNLNGDVAWLIEFKLKTWNVFTLAFLILPLVVWHIGRVFCAILDRNWCVDQIQLNELTYKSVFLVQLLDKKVMCWPVRNRFLWQISKFRISFGGVSISINRESFRVNDSFEFIEDKKNVYFPHCATCC